jgi:two-component system OmpR family response regulator
MARFVQPQRMNAARRILLVEDDPALGPVTAEAMRYLGHTVELAACVELAFERIQADCFDAIFLDLELGAERGEVLISRLRAASLAIPVVIVLSAQPLAVLERAAKQTNARSAIQKPTTIEILKAHIESIE